MDNSEKYLNYFDNQMRQLTYSLRLKLGDSGILANLACKTAGLTSSLLNGQCPAHIFNDSTQIVHLQLLTQIRWTRLISPCLKTGALRRVWVKEF